jgi:RES domain-containing protein
VTLWRISDHAELDGAGGLLAPGRWYTRGSRVVYCAPNPATSLVEVLVHIQIDSDDLPPLRYLEIEAPDDITRETVNVDALGQNWQANLEATRTAGDEWLRSGRTALLRVPSAIVPATWNVLINPEHRQSRRIRTIRIHRHAIDQQFLR